MLRYYYLLMCLGIDSWAYIILLILIIYPSKTIYTMKIHKIAYTHSASDQYIVFKECGNRDYELANFKTSVEAENWIESNYLVLSKKEGYDLAVPFKVCNEIPKHYKLLKQKK